MDPDSDADPDPAIFILDKPSRNQQKTNCNKKVIKSVLLFEGTYIHHFSKIKSKKEVTRQ
jgi:hypothetical protein